MRPPACDAGAHTDEQSEVESNGGFENQNVPDEIRRTDHRVAVRMGAKIGSKLLEYRHEEA
eukprot:SAG11_NODE_292_length_11180_cov_6.023825_8_plen_61_part_00